MPHHPFKNNPPARCAEQTASLGLPVAGPKGPLLDWHSPTEPLVLLRCLGWKVVEWQRCPPRGGDVGGEVMPSESQPADPPNSLLQPPRPLPRGCRSSPRPAQPQEERASKEKERETVTKEAASRKRGRGNCKIQEESLRPQAVCRL